MTIETLPKFVLCNGADGNGADPDQAAMAAIGRYWRLLEVIGREGLDEDGKDIFRLPPDYTLELAFQARKSIAINL